MPQPTTPNAPDSQGQYKRLAARCGAFNSDAGPGGEDKTGCLLADGHDGPHEYHDEHGKAWLWVTDMECTCEHCLRCEGDYCTEYWPKP